MRKWLPVVAIAAVVQPFVLMLGTAVHEGGHVLAAIALGEQLQSIVVLPGLQIYPHFELVEWQYWVARVSFSDRFDSQFAAGLVGLSGSIANAVVAYVALAVLYLKDTPTWVRVFLLNVVFVLGLDVVTYTFLPPIGLRHWVLVGGAHSETLAAAYRLGIPLALFVAATAVHGAAIIWFGGVQLRRFFCDFGRVT